MLCQLSLLAALLPAPSPPTTPVEPLRVRVQVVDSACQGIPGATVLLGGTVVGVSTTADGWAELTLPPAWLDSAAFVLDVQNLFCIRQRLRVPLPIRRYPLGQVSLTVDWPARRAYEQQRPLYYRIDVPRCSRSEPPIEPLPALEPEPLLAPRPKGRPAAARRQRTAPIPKR